MKLETSIRLLKPFETCPHCNNEILSKNVIVTENSFSIKCSCGWKLKGTETITAPRARVKAIADVNSIKTCGKCNRELPANSEYFSTSKRGLYGLRSVCKRCDKIYRDINREKKNEYNRRYRLMKMGNSNE